MDNQGPNNYNYNNGPGNNGSGGNGNNGGNRPGGNGGRNNRGGQGIMAFILLTLVALFVYALISNSISHASTQEKSYSDFIKQLDKGNVKSVEFDSYEIDYKLVDDGHKDYDITYYTGRVADDELVPTLKKAKTSEGKSIEIKAAIPDNTSTWIFNILSFIVPLILLWVLLAFVSKKMGGSMGMGVGKSTAKVYVEKSTGVNFKDVAGQDEAKESLQEVVDFLHNPKRYTDIGAKLPKGALLVGPPGTGKTLLAKAVAGEAGVPFFTISGSDFVEMFVGVGASRVRDLFEDAKKNAPCIVFIDEIDAVARRRGTGMGGGHDEREQTLNQMLVEMDGFGTNEGIIVLAATNRVDILDPAILRPGRFDRKVMVGRPDVKGREEILRVHVRNKPLSDDVDLHEIARTTAGFAGADLENLMNEAAICAAKQNRQFIKKEDVDKCFVKIGIGGEKKSRLVPEKERKITAYHESGHAILFHLLSEVGPVHLVSIIPNGRGAGGYTMPLPENDNVFMTKKHMLQDIMVSFGGRIAEELIFGDITTGASADIKQATQTAQAMVVKYGMSEKVGLINYEVNSEEEVFLGRDLGHARNYSEKVAAMIDKEVRRIMDECYQEAKLIIESHIDVLHRCAAALLEKERINRAEFEALFEVSPTETYPDGLDTTGLNL